MSPPEMQPQELEKLSEMKAAVAARLKRVCDGMDEQSFEALVVQIAEFKVKWGDSLVYDNPPALDAWMFGRGKGDGKK